MPPIYGSGGAAVAEGQRMSDALSERYYTPQAGQVVGSMLSPLSLIPGGTGSNIATKILTGAGAGAIGAALGTPIRDVDQKTPWEVAKEVGSNAATGAKFGGGLSLVGSAVGKLLGVIASKRAPGPGWVEVRPGEWVDKPVADKLKPYLDAGLTLPDAAAAKEFKRGLPAAPTTAQRLEAQGIARGTVPAETVWGAATPEIPQGPVETIKNWIAAPGPSNQNRSIAKGKLGQLADQRMTAITPTERTAGPVVEGAAPVRTRIAPAPVGTPQGAGYRADMEIRRVVENERAPASKLYAEFLGDHGDTAVRPDEFKGILDEARGLNLVTEAQAQAIPRLERRGAELFLKKEIANSPTSSVGEGLTLAKDRLAQMEARARELEANGKPVPQTMNDSISNLRNKVESPTSSVAEGVTLVRDRLAQMEARAKALTDAGKDIPQTMQDSLTNLRTMVRKVAASKSEMGTSLAQMEARAKALVDSGKQIPQSMQDSLTNLRTAVRKAEAAKTERNDRINRLIDAYGDHAADVRNTAIQPTVEGLVEMRRNVVSAIQDATTGPQPDTNRANALKSLRGKIEDTLQNITGEDYAKFTEANQILSTKVYPLSRESGLLVKGQADAGPLATEKAFKAITDPTSMEYQAFNRLDPPARQAVMDAAITRVATDAANTPTGGSSVSAAEAKRIKLMKVGEELERFKSQLSAVPEMAGKVDDMITVSALLSDLPQTYLHRAAEARSERSFLARLMYSMVGTLGHTAAGQKFLLGMRGTPRALSTAERKLVEEAYQRASFQVAKESAKERK